MFISFKAIVLDWPLNISTYNGYQKEFPQDIYVKFYSPKLLHVWVFQSQSWTSRLKISMEVNGDL